MSTLSSTARLTLCFVFVFGWYNWWGLALLTKVSEAIIFGSCCRCWEAALGSTWWWSSGRYKTGAPRWREADQTGTDVLFSKRATRTVLWTGVHAHPSCMPAKRCAAHGRNTQHYSFSKSSFCTTFLLEEMSYVRWKPLFVELLPQHLLQCWFHADGWKYSTAVRVWRVM